MLIGLENMSKRVTYEQRENLLDFMRNHEDLARGRISGPDAVRQKKRLLNELAEELNAIGFGSTKTPEKWYKCWQDWKSDVKSKYLKIKKARAGTGGGPSPAPLTHLKENLLQFFRVEMVEGLQGVADPLQAPETAPFSSTNLDADIIVVESKEPPSMPATEAPQLHRRNINDPLNSTLERQAAALEEIAAAMHGIAAALRQIAATFQPQM